MIYTSLLAVLFHIAQFSGVTQETKIPKETNLRVGSAMISCSGYEGQTACYQIQMGEAIGSADWDMTYYYIENFEYQAGYIYNLKVRFVERKPPIPEDAPKTRIIVDRVLSIETP